MRLTTQSYTATKTPDLILMVIDHIKARAAAIFSGILTFWSWELGMLAEKMNFEQKKAG